MERISRDQMLMEMAWTVSKRSTCLRLNVGALVAREGRIISSGYNGSPSGLPHCNHTNCGPGHPCTRTVHAEAGAISFAARHGLALGRSSLYCTNSPCEECSKLIINSGIIEVVYQIPYRKTEGVDLLRSAKVLVRQWEPNLVHRDASDKSTW